MGRGGLLTSFLLTTAKCITKFSNCNYVVGSCNTTCNYVVIFSIKVQLRCRLFKDNLQLRCRLLWRNLQLRCFLPDQVPTTLLTLVTQLATTLLSSRSSSNYIVDFCNTTCNYVVIFFFDLFCPTGTIDAAWSALKNYIPNSLSSQSRDLLFHAKSWQWRYINCSAILQQKTIEALKRIFWRKNAVFQIPRKPSDENELLLW